MNNRELQAARKGLFLDVTEAAEHIGNVSVRTWQRWEKGDFNIPYDVINKINELCERRIQLISTIEKIKDSSSDVLKIDYYATLEDYQIDHQDYGVIDWRIGQSVAAYFLIEGLAVLN